MFWKTLHNPEKRSKVTLVDKKDDTLSEDQKIAKTFNPVNEFFGNIIKN